MDKFDPIEWANKNQPNTEMPKKAETVSRSELSKVYNQSDLMTDIRRVADKLIGRNLDITYGYKDWLRLGFAIVDGLGEEGRQVFHDLSRLCPKYDEAECDKQYNKCLNSKGSGINVGTFFHMAKDAGVDISANPANMPHGTNSLEVGKNDVFANFGINVPSGTMAEVAENTHEEMHLALDETTFSDKIIREDLPRMLHPIYDCQPDYAGKDKMLLGSLTAFSGVIPKSVYGIYDGRKVYTPLYLIIYGTYASSKGDLEAVKKIVAPIKKEMRIEYEEKRKQYEIEKAAWDAASKKDRGPEPKEPVPASPFIPANSSASAVYRALDANGGSGLMFETEADTLTNMLSKSEYGDYTDLLRKCFHHESISMVRVSEKIYLEIESPRLAVMLTCTGSQLVLLLPAGNISNGLASRILFYALPPAKVEFRDVFAKSDEPVEDLFQRIGNEFMPLYHELQTREGNPLQFSLSSDQQKRFVEHFDNEVKEQFALLGDGIQGFIYRLALECFRYAMVLTLLRCLSDWDKTDNIFLEFQRSIICDDRDFNTALTICECLVSHTARVYAVLATEPNDPFVNCKDKPSAQEVNFFKSLPDGRDFRTGEALEIARGQGISERTAYRMLGSFCTKFRVMNRVGQGKFIKKAPKEGL